MASETLNDRSNYLNNKITILEDIDNWCVISQTYRIV